MNTTTPATALARSVKPPSVLLMGPSGTGKTYSVPTLLAAGLEVFVLITEPNGLDTLLDSCRVRKLDTARLHWHYVEPASPGWTAMTQMAQTVSSMGYDDITKIKSGVGKGETRQFIEVLKSLANFIDDKDGQSYGDVTAFPADRALVVDSLSGLNLMAMDLTIGMKPAAHQGEWGVAMNLEEKLILQLTSQLKCYFVLIAHVDKELNEITGAQQIMAAALGRKLAPRLQRFFSEVVLTKRGKDGAAFQWSTSDTLADLKNRALPISDSLPPSFEVVVKAHQSRLAQIGAGP
jgi:hypothetical protein